MQFSRFLFLASTTFSCGIRPGIAANISVFSFSSSGKQEALGGVNNNNTHGTIANSMKMAAGTTSRTNSPDKKGEDQVRSPIDPEYPGTAVERMLNIRARAKELDKGNDLNQRWEDVRRKILWAGGLKDLPDARPGHGYTGHSFADFNHVDLTAMIPVDSQNNGEIQGIARGNFLGAGIRIASLPELGSGGSWSTCAMGCNKDPPQDVAHVQFKSRIAFKLVWVPNENFDTFVLVDDDGKLLATGKPLDGPSGLPNLRERQYNYQMVAGSKYAKEAEAIAKSQRQASSET